MLFVKLARSKWMLMAMLVLLTFIIYGNSIAVDFIGDDFHQVYVSRDCNVACSATNIFLAFGKFYRPVHLLFYRLGYLVAGFNPVFLHVVSVGLYAGVVLLLFWLVSSLGQSHSEATLAALFFAANPIHTNAVSWLAGVNESLMALWLLLCIICYVWSTRVSSHARILVLLSVLFFCLGLLSKENAVVLPAILIAYEVLVRRQSLAEWKTWGARLVPYALMDVLYYGYSRGVLGAPGVNLGESVYTYTFGLDVIQNVTYYGLSLFSPVDLYPFLGHLEEMSAAMMKIARTPIGLVALGVVAIILLVGLLWWWRRASSVTRFWLIWILLSLAPFLALGHASELYLYLASMGSSTLMAMLVTHLYRRTTHSPRRWAKVVPTGAILAVVTLYSLSTIYRNLAYLRVGNIGENIIAQTQEMHPSIPDGSQLYFANEPHVEQGLSVMGLRGVDVLSPWAVAPAMKIAYQNDSIEAELVDLDDMTAMLGQAGCYRANGYYFVWTGSELEERTCEPSSQLAP